MVDGAIKVGTGLDMSGIKSDIKKLESELKRVQKEADKLNQQEKKIRESFDPVREANDQRSSRDRSKGESAKWIAEQEAEALAQVKAQQAEVNKEKQKYTNQLEQANAELREQYAILRSSKELESSAKAGSILDKITTQQQYNSLLEQTRAKMSAMEDEARRIADANKVSYEALLKASPTYQKLSDTMEILTSTTKEFKDESEKAGNAARKAFGFAKKESDRLNASIKKGIQKVSRMAVAVLGVRGAYSLVRRAVDACLNSNEELAGRMTAIWNTLGTIIEPVVELMINGIYKILAYVNYFIKAITGIDFVAKANAKALSKQAAQMDKLTKSTKEATKALAGFDEMNVLQDNSSSSYSAPETSVAVKIPTLDLPELTDKEKEILDGIVAVFNNIRDAIEEVKIKCSELIAWWHTLDEETQKLLITLGIAGLVGALIGGLGVMGAFLAVIGVVIAFNLLLSGDTTDTLNALIILLGVAGLVGILIGGKAGLSVAAAFAAVAGAIVAFNLLLSGDTSDAIDAFIILLGVAGLVGMLIGGAKGVSVAASIAAVSAVITAFNLLINGDTTDAITGLILLLGGAGLAGYLWGGVKGVAVGIAIASVISILNAFNKLLNGDTSDALEAVIQIITGAAGIIFAFKSFKAIINGANGVSAVLTALGNPLFLCVGGFAVLAAGILYLSENWGKMNGAQKAITILTALAAAAAAAAIAIAVFHTAWTIGIAAAAIAAGVALLGLSFAFTGGNKNTLAQSGQSMAQGFYNSSNFNGSALPKLAQGAIVNRPGRGVPAIVGEAGAEAVLPLENNTEWMDILADKIGGNVTIPIMLDGRKIATYVVDIQKKKAFAMNGA